MDKVFGRDEVISSQDLKPFTRRSDRMGLAYLTGHLGALGLTGYLLYLSLGTPWVIVAMPVHGVILTFLYGTMHECSHGNAFRSRWLNEAVYFFVNVLYISTPQWYRYKHAHHHRYTQVKGKDTDMVLASPASFGQYLYQCLGLKFWHRNLGSITAHAMGRMQPLDTQYLSSRIWPRVVLESRIILGIYATVAIVSVAAGSWAAVIYWLLPRFLGEPVLRSFRVCEHTGCHEGPNLRVNTRTTRTNPVMLALFWNMPYHAEHHLCPTVPFHQLPALHKKIGHKLHPVGASFFSVHRDILRNHLTWRSRASAT